MRLLTLTGWAQASDALQDIAPEAQALEYLAYDGEDAFWSAHSGIECEAAIGWSLGGLVLARGIAEQKLRAQKIILLAAPFRFLQSKSYPSGTSQEQWQEVTRAFKKNPTEMLTRFDSIVLHGDAHYKSLREHTPARSALGDEEHARLGEWLRYLGRESAEHLAFENFPSTLIIHGEEDAVVPLDQATYWQRALPKSDIIVVPGCSHAPQWHSPEAIREVIETFVRVYTARDSKVGCTGGDF